MIINVSHTDTLLDLLQKHFGEASRTTVKKMVLHGNVRINGKIVKNPAVRVQPGERVEYNRPFQPKESGEAPFLIIFEDSSVVVVEKPPGMLTYGERGSGGTSVYKTLSSFYRQKSTGRGQLFVVHRLDREVSGLVLFAKHETVQQKLKDNWSNVVKKYYALVEGRPPARSGTLKSYLAEDHRQLVHSVRDPAAGKLAITHYHTVREFTEYTLLDITLETGRKNQIRVHLSEAGCPVAGDYRYGADNRFRRRVRLHGYLLSFPHPITNRIIECRSKMPAGFTGIQPGDEKYK